MSAHVSESATTVTEATPSGAWPVRASTRWLPRWAVPDVATALRYWVPDISDRDVYVCGPEPWAERVRRSALAAGVPEERIHVESFGW